MLDPVHDKAGNILFHDDWDSVQPLPYLARTLDHISGCLFTFHHFNDGNDVSRLHEMSTNNPFRRFCCGGKFAYWQARGVAREYSVRLSGLAKSFENVHLNL